MKKVFNKITAIGASILMAGLTVGVAAAANFPAPFIDNGVANVAIVYGTGEGVSSLDMVHAGNIQTTLSNEMPSTGGSISGESILLERSTDKLNLGNSAATVFVTSVNKDHLPTLLADGTYTDDSNTEYKFTQKVSLGSNLVLEHFADSDYNDESPTIGFHLTDDQHVLNYTLDMVTHPAFNASTMETTTLTLMGKNYYILDVKGLGDTSYTTREITLLDTATSSVLNEGETVTLQGKTVSIAFIGSNSVKLEVDGTTTNTLSAGSTHKLSDGTYIGIKEINVQDYAGGIKQVEFSIGSGKLKLTHGSNVELNDNTLEEIIGFIEVSSNNLDKVILQWSVDDESFITPSNELIMPGFESLKFSFGGFIEAAQEEIKVESSGSSIIRLTNVPLKQGGVTIDLLGADSTGAFTTIGKDSSNRLVTSTDDFLFFNQTAGDKYIVTSWNSTSEAESYFLELSMVTEDNVDKLRVINKVTSDELKITNASDATFGSVILTLNNITRDGSAKWANVSINSGGSFHELYTEKGLKVYMPYNSSRNGNVTTANEGEIWLPGTINASIAPLGHNSTTYYQFFTEEDKDANLARGTAFNLTFTESGTSNKVHVSNVNVGDSSGTFGYRIVGTDNYVGYANSDLATKTMYYTGGDQNYVEITYNGEQAYGELHLTTPDASLSGVNALGDVLVTDAELGTVSAKNLIVVGGSCINSAAANLLGGAYCGASFTSATGVGAGQFLIQSFGDVYTNGKIALLVAGYNVDDTVSAATYLRTQTVNTASGNKYIGTDSNTAELVVA